MRVQHNMSALNGQRQLNIVDGSLAKSTEKLSSGYKVNRAADDAAGLSISEKMRKQIRGLKQASENAEDGISMVQTADGALEEVTSMIQRMNELCIQAANGTNSKTDRQAIQDEISQLKTEVDRVAESTKFNELYLLKGNYQTSTGKTSVKTAHRYGEVIPRGIPECMTLSQIQDMEGIKIIYEDVMEDGVAATQRPATNGNTNSFTGDNLILANILKQSIVPQAVSKFVEQFDDAFGYLDGSTIGIGLKLYSDPTSSTLAAVKVSWYTRPDGSIADKLCFQLSVNTAPLSNMNLSNVDDRNDLEVTIVHEMMHAFMDEALTHGMISNTDRFPKWFVEGMAQTAAGGCYNGNDWINNGLGIGSNTTEADIKNAVQNPNYRLGTNTDASCYGTGYLASMYLGYKANGGGAITAQGITDGLDKILAEIEGDATNPPLSLEDVIKKYTSYTSIAAFESGFGDAETAHFVSELVKKVGNNGTGGVLTGFDTRDSLTGAGAVPGVLPDGNKPGITLFQLDITTDDVENTYPAGHTVDAGGGARGSGTGGYGGSIFADAAAIRVARQVALHIGADADGTNKLVVWLEDMDCDNIGLTDVDVTTEDNATKSIKRVAYALQKVSAHRSRLGAYQNRLEHTIKNLDNVVENTTQAESMIRDTDMAETMVKYTNQKILQQAAQSLLAQTNQANNGVLTLVS